MTTITGGLAATQWIRECLHHDHPAPRNLPTEAWELRAQADHYATAPDAPESLWRASYDALAVAIVDQWEELVLAGFVLMPWHDEGEPYHTSDAMRQDLDMKWLYYLPTANAGDLPAGHPMAERVLVRMNKRDDRGVLLLNDVFRAVHDAIAHGAGHSFGPKGEQQAWLEHRATLPASAHLALWNETRGQSLWTNYGPHMWGDYHIGGLAAEYLGAKIPLRDRPFAPQRIVDVPSAWQ